MNVTKNSNHRPIATARIPTRPMQTRPIFCASKSNPYSGYLLVPCSWVSEHYKIPEQQTQIKVVSVDEYVRVDVNI